MDTILARTAEAFGLTIADLKGTSRAQHVVWARQTAALLLKECGLGYSSVTIGRVLKKDHTTILHALQQATQRRRDQPAYAARLRLIEESVKYE